MTVANRLLIRWSFGWYEVTDMTGYTPEMFANPGTPEWGGYDFDLWVDAPVIREAMLSLGSSQDVNAIRSIGHEQLGIFANPRTEIATDVAPIDENDTPYLAYRVSDKVTVPDINGSPVVERVIAITVTEDAEGNPTYAPELKDLILTDQERWQTNLDKMADGTISGQSKVASPASSYAGLGSNCCPVNPHVWQLSTSNSVFSADAPEYTRYSTDYLMPVKAVMSQIQMEGNPLDGATMEIHRAVGAGWETIATATAHGLNSVSFEVNAGDVIRFYVGAGTWGGGDSDRLAAVWFSGSHDDEFVPWGTP